MVYLKLTWMCHNFVNDFKMNFSWRNIHANELKVYCILWNGMDINSWTMALLLTLFQCSVNSDFSWYFVHVWKLIREKMNKRFSHGKFCGEGKKRKSQMHPASHQEETANLVEKAQVQKKKKIPTTLKHRGSPSWLSRAWIDHPRSQEAALWIW